MIQFLVLKVEKCVSFHSLGKKRKKKKRETTQEMKNKFMKSTSNYYIWTKGQNTHFASKNDPSWAEI